MDNVVDGGNSEEEKFKHPGGMHSHIQIVTSRNKIAQSQEPWIAAYEALIEQADEGLEMYPDAVEDFNVPGFYIDAKGHREMMGKLSKDAWIAYSCAAAYQLTVENKRFEYAKKAVQILSSWAEINKKTSNHDGDLAMADSGVGLVLAAELMTDYDGWSQKQRLQFENWLCNVYLHSCEAIVNKENNWGDWGIMGCIASHYFLNDEDALDDDIALIRKKIANAVAFNGSMPNEIKREKNGMWYTYFALAPLTAACQIAWNARKVDLFHYKTKDGTGIERALDYLLKYCYEPETWPYYKGTDLNLPKTKTWPGNLFEAMAGIYEKKEYESWIKKSRPIMYHGHHYAWAIPTLLQTLPVKEKMKN